MFSFSAPTPRKLNPETSLAKALAEMRLSIGDSSHWYTDSCTAPTQQLATTFGLSCGTEAEMPANAFSTLLQWLAMIERRTRASLALKPEDSMIKMRASSGC